MLAPRDITKLTKAVMGLGGKHQLDFVDFFTAVLHSNISLSDTDMKVLFAQFGMNSDHTVDTDRMLTFLANRTIAYQRLYFGEPFPRPFVVVPVDSSKSIVRFLFHAFKEENKAHQDPEDFKEQTRAFVRGRYVTITSDGVLKLWSDRFDSSQSIPLFKQKKQSLSIPKRKKIMVEDMVLIKELKQLVVSTSDREILFYNCDCGAETLPELLPVSYSLITDSVVTSMCYWSNGTKSVFAFGDRDGYLYVFLTFSLFTSGLFCLSLFKKGPEMKHPSAHLSTLLHYRSHLISAKVHNFYDACRQVKYFPIIDTFVMLSNSSREMVLTNVNTSIDDGAHISKSVFDSRGIQKYFMCVEYASSSGEVVTGGSDGLLRLWLPSRNLSCVRSFLGHCKPIIYIRFNHTDRIFLSLSEDMGACVWTESWQCRQRFHIDGMEQAPVTSLCYNIYNNEIVVANSNIRRCLGRGTEVYQRTATSHYDPLCAALIDSRFRQVISLCQRGVITVWDMITGKAVMQFNASPHHVSVTAMAFDEPEERLITISWNGKVRLWNYNGGAELAVLSVVVPHEATGIVCTKTKAFVSMKDSKVVFDMDLEGDRHMTLEHHSLSDISSMDTHENTLVASSCNGNIVIWDADSGETLYCIDSRDNPRTLVAFKNAQGRTRKIFVNRRQKLITYTPQKSPPMRHKSATGPKSQVEIIHVVLCLKCRENTTTSACMLTSAGGLIYAWSSKSKGGLLAKFRAVKEENEAIITMSADKKGRTLLTADMSGRVHLWDIREFGLGQTDEEPFEDIGGWRVSLAEPPLLGSWQTHHKGVVSAVIDPSGQHIVTAGLDHNVRLWTNTGMCRGIFGRHHWDLTQPCKSPRGRSTEREASGRAKTSEAWTKSSVDSSVKSEREDSSASVVDFSNYSLYQGKLHMTDYGV